MSRVTVFCFLASYLVAFLLELSRMLGRSRISSLVMFGFGVAGFVAHTVYLYFRSQQNGLPPLLGSAHDWMLVLAWLLVLFYLFLTLVHSELAWGVFLIPVVLLFVAATYFMNQAPNTLVTTARAKHGWEMLHATVLVFGMAGTAIGFVSGVMYLIQHRRLRTRHPTHVGLEMPSLAKLAQTNRWSIIIAFPLWTLGLATGVALSFFKSSAGTAPALRDPFVITVVALWALLAVVFVRLLSNRQAGVKHVVWLTICACGFVLLTLIGLQILTQSQVLPGSWHTGTEKSGIRNLRIEIGAPGRPDFSPEGVRFDSPGRSPGFRVSTHVSAPTGRNSNTSNVISRPVGASIQTSDSFPGLRPGLSNLSPLGPRPGCRLPPIATGNSTEVGLA